MIIWVYIELKNISTEQVQKSHIFWLALSPFHLYIKILQLIVLTPTLLNVEMLKNNVLYKDGLYFYFRFKSFSDKWPQFVLSLVFLTNHITFQIKPQRVHTAAPALFASTVLYNI